MAGLPSRIPKLRRHKPSARAVVTLGGKDYYLGPWPVGHPEPSPEIREEYERLILEWMATGRRQSPTSPQAVTVEELLVRFWEHVETHYRHSPSGEPTSEVGHYRLSLRPLRHLFGKLPVTEFTPLKLKAVRQLMLEGYRHPKYGEQPPLSRKTINQRMGRIVRAIRWGVQEELVPPVILQGLLAVKGLQKGRTTAREMEPIAPVDAGPVEATLRHLSPSLCGLVRFQLHTGARPGEACALRLGDIDRSGAVWFYRPTRHKTAWRGKARIVAIGPRAQEVLREFIAIRCPCCRVEGRPPRIGSRDGARCGPCTDRHEDAGLAGPFPRIEVQKPDSALFSPARDRAERFEDRRRARKSKVQPSQQCRKKRHPKRRPGECFTSSSYAAAVRRASERAGVAPWSPNQLRHALATEVRKRFGLEAAQVALGHSQANITEVYAERDMTLAERVAREIG
ncbi:MAG: site-specific integrase [Gemmataceae bacterium]